MTSMGHPQLLHSFLGINCLAYPFCASHVFLRGFWCLDEIQLTYAALSRADVDVLQAICDYSGYKSKHGKKHVILKMMQFGYDSFGPEVLGDKNVMQVALPAPTAVACSCHI